MDKVPLKMVIVGEIQSGKTWLWQNYFQHRKPSSYSETIFDNYSAYFPYNGREIPITLFEVCGDENYTQLRTLTYNDANVIIFCISVESQDIKQGKPARLERWVQELKENCKNVPIIVVGTKKDLRDDPDPLTNNTIAVKNKLKPLKYKEIVNISKKFKHSLALECSCISSKHGLDTVFQTALKLGLRNKSKR